ncbi:MAG: hypothetical protein IT370_26500 [Deltaproteobacteria bacterium]|nr:hypothetical protein [Deltaproteobacteria bacterium]
MSKRPFLASVPGIIGSLTAVFALAAAGVMAFLKPGYQTEMIGAIIILCCIGGSLVTVYLSVMDHELPALGILLALPAITVYYGVIQMVPGAGALVGGCLLGAAVAGAGLMVRGNLAERHGSDSRAGRSPLPH